MRTIPTWWKQPSFLKFKKLYSANKDRALFFLGSGISIQAGLPNWQELLEQLLRKSQQYFDELTQEELDALSISRNKEEYPRIGSALKKKFKDAGKEQEWRRVLEEIIDDPPKVRKESPIHNAIASLEWHSIVTTNYDALLEEAYARVRREELIVSRPQQENEPYLETERRRFVYKIHGSIRDKNSPIVLTEEDYRMYDESDENQTQAALRGVLRTSWPILFAGYSHDDETMKRFYHKAMRHTPKGNTFALVPVQGPISEIKDKVSSLTTDLDINFIAYSAEDDHSELLEFFRYLSDPSTYDASYNLLLHAKRPTIVMVHCGGTIGSSEGEDDLPGVDAPLRVSTVPSRFHPRLNKLSEKLVEWYQDSYNLGSRVAIDVQWEVLPEEYQLFSENATPDLWNAVLKKVENVVFKYFQAPRILGDATHLELIGGTHLQQPEYQKVLDLYEEEREQYQRVFPGKELSPRQFISDFQSRYILGIVLLFGTDTMSYLVSALSFGFQHMPCSVVVTGSNQPPDTSIAGRSQFFNKSDAWKNILTTFYFLQSFGHTLTDAFISFGDTIHHGVNVRKIASEMGPANASISSDVEPFVFRNLHIHGQYMFRLIDGVFCNNYYTSERIPYSSLVGTQGEDFLDLRHIRRDPLQRQQGGKELSRSEFCHNSAVCHVVATPSAPLIDIGRMCSPENGPPLRVALIEGYASGTYPTIPSSNFSTFLYDLYRHGIPIFLISQYGIPDKQRKYDLLPINGVNIPVHTWHGLTVESALPILSLVLKDITDGEWQSLPAGGVESREEGRALEELINHRIQLVIRRIRNFFRDRPNILTLEIEPSDINKQERSAQFSKARANMEISDLQRHQRIKKRGPISLANFNNIVQQLRSRYVFLYPHDFSVLISETARRDERKGCGPDGFAALSDLGFEYGLSLVSAVAKALSLKSGHGFDILFQRPRAEQEELLEAARRIIDRVVALLQTANVATVSYSDVSFPPPSGREGEESSARQAFSFTITSVRLEEPEYTDEKFTAVSLSTDDSRFFESLASGCESENELEKHYRGIEAAYELLLRNKWRHRTSSLDWLLLGLFKGVTCGLAQFLRFDDLAVEACRSTNPGYKFVFRKAAHCSVLAGDEQVFKIRLSYCKSSPPSHLSDAAALTWWTPAP